MGPIALFDKSFLQSLSVDESVWFDHYFMANICPLFYVETLADLHKSSVRAGRTPEQEVAIVAQKTPEVSGGPNAHHQQLCIANLMGQRIPMTGQIPIAGGRPVRAGGKTGVVYEASPESQAFSRWQQGHFQEVERLFARSWREMLANLDLEKTAADMRRIGIDPQTCKSLDEAFALANAVVHAKVRPFEQMKLVFTFLSLPRELERPVLERWSVNQYPALAQYAPYVAYVLTVELFFQIALGAHLIPAERPSNRVDIAYLFYLPFSMIFVSTDKLHRRCTRYFLRADQEFVWGEDLKAELRRVNAHFAALPEHERELGVMKLAPTPIGDDSSLLVALWNRHAPNWRRSAEPTPAMDPEAGRKLVAMMKELHKAPALHRDEIDFNPSDPDQLSIQRFVRKKKGSWWQLPKDLPDVDDEDPE